MWVRCFQASLHTLKFYTQVSYTRFMQVSFTSFIHSPILCATYDKRPILPLHTHTHTYICITMTTFLSLTPLPLLWAQWYERFPPQLPTNYSAIYTTIYPTASSGCRGRLPRRMSSMTTFTTSSRRSKYTHTHTLPLHHNPNSRPSSTLVHPPPSFPILPPTPDVCGAEAVCGCGADPGGR